MNRPKTHHKLDYAQRVKNPHAPHRISLSLRERARVRGNVPFATNEPTCLLRIHHLTVKWIFATALPAGIEHS